MQQATSKTSYKLNKALQKSKLLEEILSSIQDGFVVVDKNLRYVFLNKKAEKIIGISQNKLLGKSFTKTFPDHKLDLKKLLEEVNNANQKKKTAHLEIYFQPLDKWFSLFVYPFKENFSVIFQDITEKKQLEMQLAHSNKQLDTIFKNVSDGIVIQKKNGEVVYANGVAAIKAGFSNVGKMLSLSTSSYQNRFIVSDEQNKPVTWNRLPARQVVDNNSKSAEIVACFFNKKTRKEIWAYIKASRIPGAKGETLILSIIHDITILKRIEKQKDEFLSMISHELKTPLTSSKIYLHMLQKKYMTLQDTHTTILLEKVKNSIEKLSKLVYTLLDLSRAQEGKLLLQKQQFSFTTLIKEVIKDIQPLTDHTLSIKNIQEISILADRDRIEQVLINLIFNAIKYSYEAKEIFIDMQKQKQKVIVFVQDFGSGIPQQEQNEVFERFYQASLHKTFPGLGVGLYISSEIIKAHGGKIWVKSSEGKGSKFYFTIPLKQNSTASVGRQGLEP